jgi:hypothetical protein
MVPIVVAEHAGMLQATRTAPRAAIPPGTYEGVNCCAQRDVTTVGFPVQGADRARVLKARSGGGFYDPVNTIRPEHPKVYEPDAG